jgi:DNA-binding FadR family transcriptional regulator
MALIDADMAFHQALYQASGNPLILSSAKMHWCHIRRVMGEVLRGDSIRQSVWDEHEAIAQAVAAGDVNLASSLSQGHGGAASAFMIKQLLKKD